MKKFNFIIAVIALVFLTVLPSCQQKEDPVNEPFNISVRALLEAHEEENGVSSEPSSRALIENPGTNGGRWLLATWEAGDKVYVYKFTRNATNASEMFKKVGVLTATMDGVSFQDYVGDFGGSPGRRLGKLFYETELAGSIDGDLDANEDLLFSYKHELGFSYSGQKGTLEDLDNNYDYALCYIESAKIDHKSKIHLLPGSRRPRA